MTREIKQNALKAEKEHGNFNYQYQGEAFNKGYIAGAHSRDEEIKELKEEIESLKEQYNSCFEGFSKRGTKLGELMKENVKLNNPWISVEDRLPEKNCTVFVTTNGLDEDVAHFRVKSKRFITVAKEKQKLLKKEESTGSYSICGDCIKEERYYSKGEREDITDSVTHWMPIPELKKGE